MTAPADWTPHPGPQTRFLSLTCREALYGGSAGGGKSQSLLADATRYIGRGYGPDYSALLLRRTFPDLEKSLIEKSRLLYPRLGGSYNSQQKVWRFPGGETIWFGYCEHESDVYQYQGAEFQFIGWDELTQFTEKQYLYLFSRLRSAAQIPLRMRATTNPGGEGHDWVFRRFGPWLDPKCAVHAEPGQVLYFRSTESEELQSTRDDPESFGRCFVPAKLSDNPSIASDGEYRRNLQQLDPVTRAQLRDGNWLARPSRGMYFKRGWLRIVDVAPADCRWIRYWDRASTGETEAVKRKRSDPDYSVGLKLGRAPNGIYYVSHVDRFREGPFGVQDRVKRIASQDGKLVVVGIEQDPAQAGEAESLIYVRMLDGYNVRRFPARQDKITRAQPISAQTEAGNVCLVRGPWNDAFIEECEAFPEGNHDDQVDAFSGAHNALNTVSFAHGSTIVPFESVLDGEDIGW